MHLPCGWSGSQHVWPNFDLLQDRTIKGPVYFLGAGDKEGPAARRHSASPVLSICKSVLCAAPHAVWSPALLCSTFHYLLQGGLWIVHTDTPGTPGKHWIFHWDILDALRVKWQLEINVAEWDRSIGVVLDNERGESTSSPVWNINFPLLKKKKT